MRTVLVGLLLVLFPGCAWAQFNDAPASKGPTLGKETTVRVRLGVIVQAAGQLFRAVATVPVPDEWPEQSVTIINEDVTPNVKNLSYKTITGGGGSKLMVVEIPQLAVGQEAHALVTFEVTRRAIGVPADTSIFAIPKKLSRPLMIDVGPSPFIESRHPKIIAAAKEAAGASESDWNKVETLYDWTRNNVTYKNGGLKGAVRALHDKEGYTDELTSLFIALCRVHKIPARTVFVPGHCYAEFYLEDDEGQGHWFPCQAAGVRSFGAIDEVRPIMQKGDNFSNPENPKEKLRWVKEYFHASARGANPKVKFISEPVAE
ncbi:MAG: transglutaminase-like domain-containing protein [Pirellulales bacterium]